MSFGRGIFLTSIFLLLCSVLLLSDVPIEYLKVQLQGMGIFSYVAFVLILILAVVAMPLTVMPLIPIATAALGPLPTALLSVVGWTIGGSIAFLIARHLGRPLLVRYVSLEKLTAIEDKIPAESHFWVVVLLRLTLPVDLISYGLGLTKSLSFSSYFVGTLVGVSWFSFAFAYIGEALFTGNRLLLLEFVLPSLGIFLIAWYILKLKQRDK